MKIVKLLLAAIVALLAVPAWAQRVQVEQKIDSVSILIGQQAHLSLQVTAPQGARLQWPKLHVPGQLLPGVEILSVEKKSPAIVDGMSVEQRVYTLTSFHERLYALPPLVVRVNGKSYQGAALALKVLMVPVDTLHPNKFFPPEDVQDNPFSWNDWQGIFWLSLVFLVLGAGAVYVFICLKRNRPIIAHVRIVKRIPAHRKALHAIDEIKAKQLVSSEDQKSYYTQLTDAVRLYIQERFGFNAMEMTSNEIIARLQQANDQKGLEELRELFRTADLVKFAKYSALINENDLNLLHAAKFIDETKTDVQETIEKVVEQLSEDEAKTRKNHFTLKVLLYVLSFVLMALLAYIVYQWIELIG